jgi:hypothetical protein
VLEENGQKVGYFVIVVHLAGMLNPKPPSTQGWVVTRKLEEFLALHHKIIQVFTEVL